MKAFWVRAAAAALLAFSLGAAAKARAGSVELSPITLQMIGKERTTTLRVRNTEAQPITLQLRAVDWNQANGEDVYTPSQALAVSPPVFTLKPGETQTVRVVVEGVTAIRTERAFRLILDQIPESHLKGETGVIVPIRVLLPVFLTPSTASRPQLSWKFLASPSGGVLTASNTGDSHERLVGLKVTSGATQVASDPGLSGYVLAGASRTWPLADADAGAGTAKVSVTGEGLFTPIKADVSP
jgi:fimbrial chaperone protein